MGPKPSGKDEETEAKVGVPRGVTRKQSVTSCLSAKVPHAAKGTVFEGVKGAKP